MFPSWLWLQYTTFSQSVHPIPVGFVRIPAYVVVTTEVALVHTHLALIFFD